MIASCSRFPIPIAHVVVHAVVLVEECLDQGNLVENQECPAVEEEGSLVVAKPGRYPKETAVNTRKCVQVMTVRTASTLVLRSAKLQWY